MALRHHALGAYKALNQVILEQRQQTDVYLHSLWNDLMDAAGPQSMAYVAGAIDSLHAVGILKDEIAELWHHRIQDCPENTPDDPGHMGGRAWCAFCGNIVRPEDTDWAPLK